MGKKEITYNDFSIEKAKAYYLVPIEDQESLFLVGNSSKLQKVKMVMDAKDVIATTGINTETCYILVALNNKEVEEILKKADQIPTKRGRPLKSLEIV